MSNPGHTIINDPLIASGGIPEFTPTDRKPGEKKHVIIEMKSPVTLAMTGAMNMAADLETLFPTLSIDATFGAITLNREEGQDVQFEFGIEQENYVVKATVDSDQVASIEASPNVIRVWDDTPIAPFACPIPPCDCDPHIAKGSISDVAKYLGADKIWAAGCKGKGITVAVADGGINAKGRNVLPGEPTGRIDRVVDGYPSDWGRTASNWDEHGNMCATDVLGMAPEAEIMDIRISGPQGSNPTIGALISNAIAGFQYCIDTFKVKGYPQVMTNSWGIYQENWDKEYARNPQHPFTRKMREAIEAGIIVLFAAGNCGGTCPDGRCGADNGPGKSIWGANGHPLVMTVGAVNKDEKFVGYSSQGPAALNEHKPDFCSITHFKGYFGSDSGTSAATPIAAGIAALMVQKKKGITQQEVKKAFMQTAKDIGPAGWDQHSGQGIIQGKAAFDAI